MQLCEEKTLLEQELQEARDRCQQLDREADAINEKVSQPTNPTLTPTPSLCVCLCLSTISVCQREAAELRYEELAREAREREEQSGLEVHELQHAMQQMQEERVCLSEALLRHQMQDRIAGVSRPAGVACVAR